MLDSTVLHRYGKGLRILARKVSRNLRDYGIWTTAKKSLAGLFQLLFVYRVYRLYAINLSTARGATASRGGYALRTLTRDDTSEVHEIERWVEWLQGTLQDRIAGGDLCAVAVRDGKVIAFDLVTFGDVFIPLLEMKRRFRRWQAWSDQIFVVKEYRRTGLTLALRCKVFDELRKRGIRKLYAGTLRNNLVSLASARKAGFREVAEVHYVKVLSFRTWRYEKPHRTVASVTGQRHENSPV